MRSASQARVNALKPAWPYEEDCSESKLFSGLHNFISRQGGEVRHHKRKQLLRSFWIALLNGFEDARDIAHAERIVLLLKLSISKQPGFPVAARLVRKTVPS